MVDRVKVDITADRRTWYRGDFVWLGQDFTTWTLKMQVRATKDSTATPLLNLGLVGSTPVVEGVVIWFAGVDTAANHITAGRLTAAIYSMIDPLTRLPYTPASVILLSQLRILANDTHMAAMPPASTISLAGETGDDLTLYYDLIGAPSGGQSQALMGGKFIVRSGVSI
jgi:hypothetical protein